MNTSNFTIERNAPMSRHTTIGIGGGADFFITVSSRAGLLRVFGLAKKISPVTIIGRGSKLLVSDKGIRGLTVSLSGMNDMTFDGSTVTAGAGAGLPVLARTAAALGLSGLEWSVGIPASLGGAVVMNAGAFGGCMANIVTGAEVFDGVKFKRLTASECGFSYRGSVFGSRPDYVITAATMRLTEAPAAEVEERMAYFAAKRLQTQPVGVKSAGSAYKRPAAGKGNLLLSAGELIDKAGLKGYANGGAEVSAVHANFIINTGGATCQNALEMLKYIEAEVKAKFGVSLEREIITIGEF